MILACSGGSNVGQITNQAAVELTREGFGKMFCLAGVAAGLKSFVKAAGDSPDVLVLDGCPVGCAKAAMVNAGLSSFGYMVVTELGIDKVKDRALAMNQADVDAVKAAARSSAELAGQAGGCSSCAG
ncbi:MAG: putative zinc-binding protein [Thermodesulfobacteriota bacterium]